MHDSHSTWPAIGLLVVTLSATLWPDARAAQVLTVDHEQVRAWNRFADQLYMLHSEQLARHPVRTSETIGGYAGNPAFYREVRYLDAQTGRLLSVVRWERQRPDVVHTIEVYRYHPDGRLSHDYLAAYLPRFRNAPIQTLVNVHHQDDELRAFRQFDASGVRIYEQCSGRFFGEPVMVSIEQDELPIHTGHPPPGVSAELYSSCFDALPGSADAYLADLEARVSPAPGDAPEDQRAAIESDIELLSGLIGTDPTKAQWYLDRGRGYFQLHAFDEAIADFDRAVALDGDLDEAWFWRGMARGRAGRVPEAIADLSVYIARHPDDSRAHTKRGVRRIWLGDLAGAQVDLERAVTLDPTNAEAHDDLGVLYAQQQRLDLAEQHFRQAIRHDPSYQKAHHNLAMILHLGGDHAAALSRINQALRLEPESRNGLLLKAAILQAMGRAEESAAIDAQAEFLPEGNWSERLPLR